MGITGGVDLTVINVSYTGERGNSFSLFEARCLEMDVFLELYRDSSFFLPPQGTPPPWPIDYYAGHGFFLQ